MEQIKTAEEIIKDMVDKAKLFEKDSIYNALANAIILAAEAETFMDDKIYDFLENTPRTSMVVFICDSLVELGFTIKRSEECH